MPEFFLSRGRKLEGGAETILEITLHRRGQEREKRKITQPVIVFEGQCSSLAGTSALDRFTSQLESRLLSDLLSDVKDGKTGSITTDDFIVNIINDDLGNLVVNITDRLTGEVSEIIIGQN